MSALGRVLDAIVPYRKRVRMLEEDIKTVKRTANDAATGLGELAEQHASLNGHFRALEKDLQRIGGVADDATKGLGELTKQHQGLGGHFKAFGVYSVRSFEQINKKLKLPNIRPDPDLQIVRKGEKPPSEAPVEKRKKN